MIKMPALTVGKNSFLIPNTQHVWFVVTKSALLLLVQLFANHHPPTQLLLISQNHLINLKKSYN